MRRIPVVATVRDAYLFTVTHLGGVIGLIWIPMLLLTVMGFFSFQRYCNDLIQAMVSGNSAELGPSLLMMLGFMVAALLLGAIMYVAVVQMALGMRTAPTIAHFAFGPAEWRMFRALIAFSGLVFLVLLPISMAMAVVANKAPAAPVLLSLLVYGVVIVAAPRFFLLLPAISVAESAPVLRRAWQLSMGNFWRLLAVLVASIGPLFVLFLILQALAAGRDGSSLPTGDQQVQMIAALMRMRDILPVISGLAFLVAPLFVALFAGASVSAWRALKDEPLAEITA